MSGALLGGGAVALVAFGLYVAGGQNGSMPWENNAAQQQSIAPPPPVSSVAPPPPVSQPSPSQPAVAAVGNEFAPPPNMGSGIPLPPGTIIPVVAPANGATPTPTVEPKTEIALVALIEKIEPAVVRIQVKTRSGGGIGSGFLVDKEGTVVTNYHVIAGATSAEAEFRDGRKVPVEGFYVVDQNRDIAVLKIAPQTGVDPLPIATEIPQKGTRVAAFGAPLGFSFTASEGIISAIRTAKDAKKDEEAAGSVVQTTAPISPGNSGGPLVNMFGEVVAANTFVYSGGSAQNLNFGISCTDISDLISKKAMTTTPLSPEALPEEEDGYIKGAQNLAGTERGRVMLSQIREAAVLTLPLTYDPTGRLMDFVLASADRMISTKLKWKTIVRSRDFKGSTALVLMIAYLEVSEDTDVAAADLVIRTQIYCRDVDKSGEEVVAIVYDKEETVCKATAAALVQGVVSRRMETGIKEYFNHLATEYRTAIRQVEPK